MLYRLSYIALFLLISFALKSQSTENANNVITLLPIKIRNNDFSNELRNKFKDALESAVVSECNDFDVRPNFDYFTEELSLADKIKVEEELQAMILFFLTNRQDNKKIVITEKIKSASRFIMISELSYNPVIRGENIFLTLKIIDLQRIAITFSGMVSFSTEDYISNAIVNKIAEAIRMEIDICGNFGDKRKESNLNIDNIWNKLKYTNLSDSIEWFIRNFPESIHIEEAIDTWYALDGIEDQWRNSIVFGPDFYSKSNDTNDYFMLGYRNVTNIEYCKFLNENGNGKLGNTYYYGLYEGDGDIYKHLGEFKIVEGKEFHAVVNVSFMGAIKYCNWLSDHFTFNDFAPYHIANDSIMFQPGCNNFWLPTYNVMKSFYVERPGIGELNYNHLNVFDVSTEADLKASRINRVTPSNLPFPNSRKIDIDPILASYDISGDVNNWLWPYFKYIHEKANYSLGEPKNQSAITWGTYIRNANNKDVKFDDMIDGYTTGNLNSSYTGFRVCRFYCEY